MIHSKSSETTKNRQQEQETASFVDAIQNNEHHENPNTTGYGSIPAATTTTTTSPPTPRRSYCMLTAVVAILMMLTVLLSFHNNNNNNSKTVALWGSSTPRGVYAHEVVLEDEFHNISFGELAYRVMPSWYELSIALVCTALTPQVQPDDVYSLRKTLLHTRDLWDLFAPVYPYSREEDLWITIRNHFDRGYELTGEFQDWSHSHVNYTKQQVDDSRDALLEWKDDFVDAVVTSKTTSVLLEDYMTHPVGAASSLQHPPTTAFKHKHESKLFWKLVKADQRPKPTASARSALVDLVAKVQLQTAYVYLQDCWKYEHSLVLNDDFHETYHNYRKELRTLLDEFKLVGTFLWKKDPLFKNALNIFKQARERLGDMNDDWNARDVYIQNNLFPDEQARLTDKVLQQWTDFCQWARAVQLEQVMESMANQLIQQEQSRRTLTLLLL